MSNGFWAKSDDPEKAAAKKKKKTGFFARLLSFVKLG